MRFVIKYPVLVHKSSYGYDVECPVLPGCVSQGDTYREAITNIKDAITDYLAAVKKLMQKRLKQKSNHISQIAVKL